MNYLKGIQVLEMFQIFTLLLIQGNTLIPTHPWVTLLIQQHSSQSYFMNSAHGLLPTVVKPQGRYSFSFWRDFLYPFLMQLGKEPQQTLRKYGIKVIDLSPHPTMTSPMPDSRSRKVKRRSQFLKAGVQTELCVINSLLWHCGRLCVPNSIPCEHQ